MKKVLFFFALVIVFSFLIGCNSQSSNEQNPTPSLTPAPSISPTVTSTIVPFSELDLEELVITEGDLPSNLEGGQIMASHSEYALDVPSPDYFFNRNIVQQSTGNPRGFVEVLVYEDLSKLEDAYNSIIDYMVREEDSVEDFDIGDYGKVGYLSYIGQRASVVFVRCNAIVAIRLNTVGKNEVISYGVRLDERLQPLVCR